MKFKSFLMGLTFTCLIISCGSNEGETTLSGEPDLYSIGKKAQILKIEFWEKTGLDFDVESFLDRSDKAKEHFLKILPEVIKLLEGKELYQISVDDGPTSIEDIEIVGYSEVGFEMDNTKFFSKTSSVALSITDHSDQLLSTHEFVDAILNAKEVLGYHAKIVDLMSANLNYPKLATDEQQRRDNCSITLTPKRGESFARLDPELNPLERIYNNAKGLLLNEKVKAALNGSNAFKAIGFNSNLRDNVVNIDRRNRLNISIAPDSNTTTIANLIIEHLGL